MESSEHVSFEVIIILRTIKILLKEEQRCTSNESMKMKQPPVIKVGSTVIKALSLTSVSGFLFLRSTQLLSNNQSKSTPLCIVILAEKF